MRSQKKTLSVQFSAMLVMLVLVAFTPPDSTGTVKVKPSQDQLMDSITFYRRSTILNWDLIQLHIKKK